MMSGVPVLPVTETMLRLGLATFLGALVGLERERLERAAGLRTHAIVALASALMMLVSTYGFNSVLGPDQLVAFDPSRVAAQVVSGIGFLGAGVIIFRKSVVRGLTTASVWAVAGLGLACGGGLFVAAGVTTALILTLQIVLRPIEQRVFAHHREHRLELRVRRGAGSLAAIETAVREAGVSIESLRVRPAHGGREDRVEIALGPVADARATWLLEQLRAQQGTQLITYVIGNQPPATGPVAGTDAESDED
ncbi:MAG: MgtC/SapB family protein [Thermomicrobiales bacterium]|nr:MgtC/SapB family protein [Thermomicrobiales bacterium]